MARQRIAQLIHHMAEQLKQCTTAASQEAWWLLQAAAQRPLAELYVNSEIDLTDEQLQKLHLWLDQRVNQHKPLQFILGTVPFCGLDIRVAPPTLIPRPETEEWTLWLIEQLRSAKQQPLRILDLCAGTGCIAFALARAFPLAEVVGTDIAPEAIALAQKNKTELGINNVTLVQGDLFDAVAEMPAFDIIVSNPPYLSSEEWETLDLSVKNWEDKQALVAHHQGLLFYERIAAQAHRYLRTDSRIPPHAPQLVVECSDQLAESVVELFKNAHFSAVSMHMDLSGKRRWLTARRS